LDRDKAFLVATPFKKRGKKSLKISDFIFALSLDLKWGPPEKVRALLREAEAEGIKTSLILQNAETIRLVKEDGSAISVVHLKKGDRVMGCTLEGGRHFGIAVKETIIEK
jgi:hypothetical protein